MHTESGQSVPGQRPPAGPADGSVPTLVARQPVFDQQGKVWGYELLFRDPVRQEGPSQKSSTVMTSTVMIDGFELMRPMLRPRQRFLINFTAEFLEAELPAMLPPDICTIEILETVNPTPKVLQGLVSLKKQGYMLALDDYIGQEHLKPFLPLVDIVKIDVLELKTEDLGSLVASLAGHRGKLLAEKVEDSKSYKLCRSFGFALFQGFFYSRPEVVRGKKLSPSQVTKTRLLALTANADPDMAQIARTIVADVYLTFKLLRFINSLYFGLPTQVRSVEHAIKLMGMQRVRQWLCVTALAEMDSAPMSQEIVYISAQRAKFLEILADRHPGSRLQGRDFSAKLFITGLFSMLETIMRVPLKEIFSSIALDKDIIQGLCERSGPLASWLGLMTGFEQGHWQDVRFHARRLGLNDTDLSEAYVEASRWSASLFGEPGPGSKITGKNKVTGRK